MTQSLEAQLTAICEQHGLTGLSLHISDTGAIYAVTHRDSRCAHSKSLRNDTFAAAVASSLAELAGKPITALAPMADAA